MKIGPNIVTDGLFFYIDAANSKSYISGSDFTSNILSTSLTGSFINNATVDYGIKNGVFIFDGSDDAILLEGTVDTTNTWLVPANSTDPFTISAWFNTNNISSTNWIISAGSGGGTNWDIKIGATSGKITFRMRTSSGGTGYTDLLSSTISTDVWYNVTGVFTGTEQTLYLNGEQESTATVTFYRSISTNIAGAIGTFYYNGAPHSGDYDGEIGPLSFYKSKALSPKEVLQNYNALKGRFG
jgi:hypothetical protein